MAKIPKGKREKISEGIKEKVHEFKKTGKIKTGRATYKPASTKKAQKQAAAIMYSEENVGRQKRK